MAVPADQLGVRPTAPPARTVEDAPPPDTEVDDDGEVTEQVTATAPNTDQIAAYERMLAQERENAKFLKEQLDRATKGTNGTTTVTSGPPAKKRTAPLPENMYEVLADSTKLEEVLDNWVKSHGYLTAEEAATILNQKVAEVGKVGGYYQRYPDLNNPDSDLYKAAKKAGDWVYSQPEFAGLSEAGKHMLTLQMAAEHAEGLKAAAAVKESNETGRKKKIALQTGPTGGGKTTGATAEELTAEQKQVARGFGISEDEYRKYATRGVTMMRKPGGGQ